MKIGYVVKTNDGKYLSGTICDSVTEDISKAELFYNYYDALDDSTYEDTIVEVYYKEVIVREKE